MNAGRVGSGRRFRGTRRVGSGRVLKRVTRGQLCVNHSATEPPMSEYKVDK